MSIYGEITNSIVRQIHRSRKVVTVLFTDIEDSTRYWDTYGDVKGRLMVDQHNRLTFPVVKRFGGRIIKTIGDAIMASFKDPQDALRAAIGIQQVLHLMREKDKSFGLKVRIGLHTGHAIVEDNDVFGNVVNVAARVESKAKGNEILLSKTTAAKLDKRNLHLTRKGEYELKGKRHAMVLYSCDWQKCPDMTRWVRFSNWLPVVTRQKKELLLYVLATCGVTYFLYLKYLRYLISDRQELALLFLNPHRAWSEHPVEIFIAAAAAMLLLFVMIMARRVPHLLFRFLKGGFGFALLFVLAYFALQRLPADSLNLKYGRIDTSSLKLDIRIYQSQHLFVEVLTNNTPVYERPNPSAPVSQRLKTGHLLLLTDVANHGGHTWNKVLIAPGRHGWVERVTPPKLGVPSLRVTRADKFYFHYRDVYALAVGLLGFVWGWLNFRIKPT
jgi:class 3 adenylate cyclase